VSCVGLCRAGKRPTAETIGNSYLSFSNNQQCQAGIEVKLFVFIEKITVIAEFFQVNLDFSAAF
jgi:hypothetical protein